MLFIMIVSLTYKTRGETGDDRQTMISAVVITTYQIMFDITRERLNWHIELARSRKKKKKPKHFTINKCLFFLVERYPVAADYHNNGCDRALSRSTCVCMCRCRAASVASATVLGLLRTDHDMRHVETIIATTQILIGCTRSIALRKRVQKIITVFS